ncbi:MAG: hypothetical protein EOS28_30050 [Mesorhizobium sp.]|nr:MAG: hypothetical protein EOS28_30050 [Mesorhizobium sp.]
MRSYFILFTLIMSFAVSFAEAASQSGRMGLAITGPGEGELKAKQLYAVELKCRPLKKDLKKAVKTTLFGLTKTTETATHTVIVSAKRPTQAAGKTTLPDNALFASVIFSINATEVLDQRKCDEHFFFSGGKQYFITVVENYSKTIEPGRVISILRNGIKLAQPLFTLFGAGQLSAAVQPFLTAVTGIETPYKDLLGELNNGDNFVRSEPLVPGRYQISTAYSAETVIVREVASAVMDPNTKFTALFDQQLAEAKPKVAPTSKGTCNSILGELIGLGFYSPTDHGYALVHIAFRGGLNKDDVLKNCLTFDAAMAMARLNKDFYWKGIEFIRFSEDDVLNAFLVDETKRSVSPSFDAVVPYLVKLIDAGNQILRKPEVPTSAVAKANEIFAEQISLVDNTNDIEFGSLENKSPLDVLQLMKQKGVTRLGCYIQTSGATDAASDGAVAILLGFALPITAKEGSADDAITLRPQFVKGKISSIAISKNRAWIDSVLTNRTSCNELKIKKQ